MNKRIFLIGGPGSGKTTIARKLSVRYNIQFIDMDKIFFQMEREGHILDEEKDSISLISDFINNDSWISEGVYFRLNWLDQVVKEADVVFLLKIPKLTRNWRITIRTLRQILNIDKSRPANFKLIRDLIKLNEIFEQDGYTEIDSRLKKLGVKPIVVYSFEDVMRHLNQLSLK